MNNENTPCASAECKCASSVTELVRRDYRGIRPTDSDGLLGLRNPERGWRFEVGIGILESDSCRVPHIADHWPFPRYVRDGITITQAYCYLSDFVGKPISDEKIAALEADFARARKEGVKFLLRFAYDYPMDVRPSPSADAIIAHIRQLTPVVRRNIDVIYTLQTGWVGAWGEFHSSLNGVENDPESVAAIVGATLEMLPQGHFTMMRRIEYKEKALKAMGASVDEVTAETAFSTEPTARIGFFNDGTLANWWDGGTFVGEPYAQEGQHEFDRVMHEGKYLPVDGELFWTGDGGGHFPEFGNGLRAIYRLSRHCYTTFSLVHSFSELDMRPERSTLDFWKDTPVIPAILDDFGILYDPDYFEGVPYRTSYDFIRDHLGYRIAAKHAEHSEIAPGSDFEVSCTLLNTGFATPFKERHAEFVILSADGKVTELGSGLDCRKLIPGKTERAEWKGKLPDDIGAGPYSVALWLPDLCESLRRRPEYAIRLASAIDEKTVDGRRLNIL